MPDQNANAYWRMGGITVGEVEDYLYSLLPPRDEVLAEMETEAAKNRIPIIGPAVARVLYQLAMISGAKRVFEMGSAIGYSTIWLARAVGDGGRVIYTDGDPKNADRARRYFERAGVSERITVRVGDALELLSEEKEPYDIIFNDVDKTDYPRVFRMAIPHLRAGGLFITDNVLWSGRVAQPKPDAETKAILELNRLMYESREVFTTILPIRDGVSVCVKR
ncbi:MAG: O-methyltransferase [Candidatus Koribacter versatilis]|nr:O-methyltransferase [Candidatus Koribacter versatilis]